MTGALNRTIWRCPNCACAGETCDAPMPENFCEFCGEAKMEPFEYVPASEAERLLGAAQWEIRVYREALMGIETGPHGFMAELAAEALHKGDQV